MIVPPKIRAIAQQFELDCEVDGIEPHLQGHIHESYRIRTVDGANRHSYLLQRINPHIFPDPRALMENIDHVSAHIRAMVRAAGVPAADRRCLRVVHTCFQERYWPDEHGTAWRMYYFIENTHSHTRITRPGQAETAGRAFGAFQRHLTSLPAPRLHETLPHFHDTPLRYEALHVAARLDPAGRASSVASELSFAAERHGGAGVLAEPLRDGKLPERVAHNDAKLSNVLLDDQTGEALCVVDLDTVMHGTVLSDFGDMVRSMATPAAEDERDLALVTLDLERFEALAEGYLAEAAAFLTPAERALLVQAGWVITLEQGVRFLTDYLNGDKYYRTTRPEQNLDRARTQFRLVEQIEEHRGELERLIAAL